MLNDECQMPKAPKAERPLAFSIEHLTLAAKKNGAGAGT
jgi:hypothetical protein